MRLRCPNKNCPIDVPDELIGMKIRCPHCGELILLDARDRDRSAEQIQAGEPDGAPAKPSKHEPANLENQIYDGLPPLSVILALRRRQRGDYDEADYGRRFAMTEDDWKALDAYEHVLRAVLALRLTAGIGAFVLLANVFNAFVTADVRAHAVATFGMHPLTNAGLSIVLAACLGPILFGASALAKMRTTWDRGMLFWALVMAMFVVAVSAGWNLYVISVNPYMLHIPFIVFACVVFNAAALFDMGHTMVKLLKALNAVDPPEISSRLVEALKYLA